MEVEIKGEMEMEMNAETIKIIKIMENYKNYKNQNIIK